MYVLYVVYNGRHKDESSMMYEYSYEFIHWIQEKFDVF